MLSCSHINLSTWNENAIITMGPGLQRTSETIFTGKPKQAEIQKPINDLQSTTRGFSSASKSGFMLQLNLHVQVGNPVEKPNFGGLAFS